MLLGVVEHALGEYGGEVDLHVEFVEQYGGQVLAADQVAHGGVDREVDGVDVFLQVLYDERVVLDDSHQNAYLVVDEVQVFHLLAEFLYLVEVAHRGIMGINVAHGLAKEGRLLFNIERYFSIRPELKRVLLYFLDVVDYALVDDYLHPLLDEHFELLVLILEDDVSDDFEAFEDDGAELQGLVGTFLLIDAVVVLVVAPFCQLFVLQLHLLDPQFDGWPDGLQHHFLGGVMGELQNELVQVGQFEGYVEHS